VVVTPVGPGFPVVGIPVGRTHPIAQKHVLDFTHVYLIKLQKYSKNLILCD